MDLLLGGLVKPCRLLLSTFPIQRVEAYTYTQIHKSLPLTSGDSLYIYIVKGKFTPGTIKRLKLAVRVKDGSATNSSVFLTTVIMRHLSYFALCVRRGGNNLLSPNARFRCFSRRVQQIYRHLNDYSQHILITCNAAKFISQGRILSSIYIIYTQTLLPIIFEN